MLDEWTQKPFTWGCLYYSTKKISRKKISRKKIFSTALAQGTAWICSLNLLIFIQTPGAGLAKVSPPVADTICNLVLSAVHRKVKTPHPGCSLHLSCSSCHPAGAAAQRTSSQGRLSTEGSVEGICQQSPMPVKPLVLRNKGIAAQHTSLDFGHCLRWNMQHSITNLHLQTWVSPYN